MPRLHVVTAILFLLASSLAAQQKTAANAGLPPLIDRELFFGNPEIAGAQLSPDGKYLAFLKPWENTRNVWVKKVDEPFSAARLLTTETKRPVGSYLWSRDAKYVLYVKDKDGDENFNVYAVVPAAAPTAGSEAPASRDLTGLKGVRVQLYSAPKKDPDTIYIGLNDRDKAWHDLYKLKISTGERTLIRQNTEKIASWFFDESGQLRLAERVADNGDQEVLRVDSAGFTKVYSCSVFEDCSPIRFHKDGQRVYMRTNKGDDADLTALVLFDPATGKVESVESDPLKRVDFGGAGFSEVTGELAVTVYIEDHARPYFRDKSYEADYKWLTRELKTSDFSIPSRSLDEKIWLVSKSTDSEPGTVYLLNRAAHKLTEQYRIRERLPRESLAAIEIIHYKSSDGLEIPAYLTLPKGIGNKNLPLVVFPHGGPWGRDGWGYNPVAQFFANRGYAVLMPNFRGSTGYGKKFLNAGNGEWGRKMQDDITWGVKYLVAQGTVDPKRVGIMGISYGGYATLAGVAFTPDLYRAAVDSAGPVNLITLLEATPPYWEAERKFLFARMGDLNTPDGRAWLKERSPLTEVANIKTPLLVVQGANDPRVNRREAEQIVVGMRDRGLPVEYMLAPDEGHGYQRPVNNMAMFMAAEKFFAKQLDGRYQDGGSPEVVARLKELMVDPKTVVISKPIETASASAPKPGELHTGTWKYQIGLALGGQEISVSAVSTITATADGFTATETLNTPAGDASDTVTLDKVTLAPKHRTVQQGPAHIDLDFADGKATGTLDMGGNKTPVLVDIGGPLFADGPGAAEIVASLPLSEGYTTTFRNLDLLKQKVKTMQLKVVGSESVTVPAGTFETYKVEVSNGDSTEMTLWIAKQTQIPVKVVTLPPGTGGAQVTAELAN
ncbi:MAG TPA: alpha/beta fold hydrolase [Bryobacteraceae bacterium]|nr:alpha/beta fold hydrolase [Bryobacteraceae bacterium]